MKIQSDYNTIYSDDYIVVLSKRSGLLVASDRYDLDAPRLDNLASKEFGKLYAVHRIDKDTSGLVIYGRTPEAHRSLSMAFENREVKKVYHALVHGRPSWDELQVDLPLQADGDVRHRTVVNKRFGKTALTNFKVLATTGSFSWIEAKPVTGRTHQIRVHLAANDLNIVCDPLYSGNQKAIKLSDIKRSWRGDVFEERPLLDRLGLHAYKLSLVHPVTGEQMEFTAPYYKDMDSVRKQLCKLFKTPDFLLQENE
jgi:RluA family pseudouridine synthase